MRVEEGHLLFLGGLDRDSVLDILLRSVLDSNESQTKLNLLVHNGALRVCASVHDINLRNDTDSSDALGVDPSGHSETFLGGHIGVGSDDTKDDSSGVGHVPLSHAPRDLLDIGGLTLDGDESNAWQIDQGQIWARVRVDVEHDRVVNDVSRGSSNLICQLDNLVSHLAKVGKLLAFGFLRELGPGLGALRLMVETQLKWTPRHETISSREAVETDDGFEDGGFTRTLRSEHCDSRQLDEFLHTDISQVIDDADELFELVVHQLGSTRASRSLHFLI